LKKILSRLWADGEEGRQVEVLPQLCELLSIGTEESLSIFFVDSFAHVLVSLLNHESNADIMHLAVQALTHICKWQKMHPLIKKEKNQSHDSSREVVREDVERRISEEGG
jgi:hypothetical protein